MRTLVIALVIAMSSTARAEELEDDEESTFDPQVRAPSEVVGGPPIGEVLAAAYAVAGFDRDPSPSWRRRARVAGLIPWISVRTGWNTDWQEQDPEIDRSRTFEVRATWRLDRLVFDGRELQIASSDAARRRERRRLASQVIRTYFAWRRAAASAVRDSRWTSRSEEAAAELDALTEGWFSHELADPRRTASETRTVPGRAGTRSLPRP